ncbi:MAG: DUF2066 domain-containing protein [Chromatiales bacterium]|nr:DUF2066 domain-containing protein [Chromatiales bacterium]
MLRAQSKAALFPLLAVMLAWQFVHAATVSDLYVAQVPATALSGPPLDEAFALALDQVLVKVTGQRGIAADANRRRAIGPPAPLVRQYQPMPAGQVRVSFDPVALRQRLDAANLPVWADERPLTLVFLPPEPPPGAAAGPGSAGEPARSVRQLFQATAASRGIPVVLAPDPVAGSRTGAEPLLDPAGVAGAAGADLVLAVGPLPAGGPAMLRWTLARGSDRSEWQGDAVEGAHGLADRLATRYATTASSGRVLRLRITGVDSFDAYGRLQAYLRGMGLVQSAELKEIAAGQLVYEVAVRGDVRQLDDAFALRRVLEPAADPAGGDLVYRLVTGAFPGGAERL